ncbi:serine protease, partial [Corallococcus llansteffanensis]
GTCAVDGANAVGDTIVRVHDSTGWVVAENDDAFGTCGGLSRVVFRTDESAQTAQYQIRVGCFGNTSCRGTAAYVTY